MVLSIFRTYFVCKFSRLQVVPVLFYKVRGGSAEYGQNRERGDAHGGLGAAAGEPA